MNNTSMKHINLAVDTEDDFKKIKNIICQMDKPHYEYNLEDVIKF